MYFGSRGAKMTLKIGRSLLTAVIDAAKRRHDTHAGWNSYYTVGR